MYKAEKKKGEKTMKDYEVRGSLKLSVKFSVNFLSL
jgi:hypothetical protein